MWPRILKVAFCGTLVAGVMSALPSGEGPAATTVSDLDFAIPVPTSTRLVERCIDIGIGRSIAVLDVDPSTPPAWNDTFIVTRRRELPGVQISYATGPVEMPAPSASIDAWRAFAADPAVRVEPHADLRSVAAVLTRESD